MHVDATTQDLIRQIYGNVPAVLADGLRAIRPRTVGVTEQSDPPTSGTATPWSHRDVVLITYADQVRRGGQSPLSAQTEFLLDYDLDELLRCVHLLPFCPSTSDDGFSVADYLAVDPAVGDWADIGRLGESFDLMFDLVLNHCSKSHPWFEGFVDDDPEYANFFIDQDPSDDLSAVTRPRSSPLLTPFDSPGGIKHVWTTFSADQVDLNYANPAVMLKMLETLVEYARRGARIVRLDAIAYLWKEVGTDCIHRPQTHAAVKLMRRVLDAVTPGTLILTETNVPHQENISYFGAGDDEAHMVYQFSLPPLLLDAIHNDDTTILRDWLDALQPPGATATFFNFTASHDGVGVRPLEGIVSDDRLDRLVEVIGGHGGKINTRRRADGRDVPYELNITYLDAVADAAKTPPAEHARRFLATQAIMLSVRGMPAVYFHSLVGTPNDHEGVRTSGQNRRINRHKYDRDDLDEVLGDPHGLQRRVFDGYRRLLEVRREVTAFDPAAAQRVLPLPGDGLLGFVRDESVTVLANLSGLPRQVAAAELPATATRDVLAEESFAASESIPMRSFQVRWLVPDG